MDTSDSLGRKWLEQQRARKPLDHKLRSVIHQTVRACIEFCVFPVILAYHRWMRLNRSWPDGSYFTSGLASGADNMKRLPEGYEPHVHHGHISWIDATAQAALSIDRLLDMASVLGRSAELVPEQEELSRICKWFGERAWDDTLGMPTDVDRHGKPTGVKQVGSFWAMLAGLTDRQQVERMAAHLDESRIFPPHSPCAKSRRRPVRLLLQGFLLEWFRVGFHQLDGPQGLGTLRHG